MTKKSADEVILMNKKAVKAVLDVLNGETLEDAKNILDAAAYYLKAGTVIDAQSVKDYIEDVQVNE